MGPDVSNKGGTSMKMKIMQRIQVGWFTKGSLFKLAGMASVLLLLAGCGMAESSTPRPTTEMIEAKVARPQPVKICLFLDKSGSANHTRVEQIRREDLASLIELLRQSGGALAFGLIRDNSNLPLLRLSIDPLPIAPSLSGKKGNVFTDALDRAEHQKEMERFNAKHRQLEGETDRRVHAFMEKVEPILSQRADARRTDIWGAVRRADLFLDEDDTAWGQPTKRFVVFISDGQDNVRTPAVAEMKSGPQMIVVNASGSVGSLVGFNPKRFESVGSAFNHIVASIQGGIHGKQ
jgi:hypothetical protein